MAKRLLAIMYYLAVGLGVGSAPQLAQAQDTGFAAYKSANAELRVILARTAAPALSDPAYARLVSDAFAVKLVESLRAEPVGTVLDLCSEAVKTEVAYILRGLGQDHVTKLTQQAAAQRTIQRANANTLRFQDEMALATRFSAACLAMEVHHLAGFLQQLKPEEMTPVRRSGLAQVQNGLVQTVSGAAYSQLDPIRPANRAIMLKALVDNLGQLQSAMTLASRQRSVVALDRVLASHELAADARAKLVAVRKTLTKTECTGLCIVTG